ncbi:MAG: hypothetical protein KGL39_02960 [Patescibacteria group bacterium]|nr:hypothetical protein [Patescibacteria group bacterium]
MTTENEQELLRLVRDLEKLTRDQGAEIKSINTAIVGSTDGKVKGLVHTNDQLIVAVFNPDNPQLSLVSMVSHHDRVLQQRKGAINVMSLVWAGAGSVIGGVIAFIGEKLFHDK